MDSNKVTVLYVDDEQDNLFSFKANFRLKYNVLIALNGNDALKLLESHQVHIVISDQRMPQMTGVELLEKVQNTYPDIVRLLLTGYADMNVVIEAINKGKIFHYLTKPWKEEEISQTLDKAYEFWKEKKSLKTTNEQLEFMLRQKLLS
ncbi:response regulator [Arachidicoccus soli]|uniref:Response regulator n=1 Tax=Arachidicoccus soli TaxID=2341117 RepID=A0A386HT40_9BACT|nr:response regulator [Arachidicoccus soli]AYD48862.1 response regulator [Arachidicoccus soli]